NRRGGGFGRQGRRRTASRCDQSDTPPDIGCKLRQTGSIIASPAVLKGDVLAFDVACLLKPLTKFTQHLGVAFRGCGVQHPDHRHRALLRPRRHRPRRHPAEQRDELALPHSITSSARASSCGGTSIPSILAVWILMASSNLLDCTTGKSAGFAPFR